MSEHFLDWSQYKNVSKDFSRELFIKLKELLFLVIFDVDFSLKELT